jgi:uncharacterized protein YkwD
LRSLLSLSAVLFVLSACSIFAAARPSEARAGAKSLERRVVRMVNVVRLQHGLPRLLASRRLARAARGHSLDMAGRAFFDHDSSDGTPMYDRVRRHFPARRAGETLAAVSGGTGAAGAVVRMWMASRTHRAVMLDRGFRRIGVGLGRGALGGARLLLVTADFAAR